MNGGQGHTFQIRWLIKNQSQWLYTALARVSAGSRQNLPAAHFQSAKLLQNFKYLWLLMKS
jgi:hypothetical protein